MSQTATIKPTFTDKLLDYQQQVNHALCKHLPTKTQHPKRLYEAMHYAVLMGGKRVRPALVYGTAEALGLKIQVLDSTACAIECIHAYSLVHDDLPAMDDDDLRRGLPTCHIAYDEATAILAADALQALAFEIIACDENLSFQVRTKMLKLLAQAAGATGMVGGQAIDLGAVNQNRTLTQLIEMHNRKTGALIQASVNMACLAHSTIKAEQKTALADYVKTIGLAFQVQDDILDVTADTATLGKTQGADVLLNKPTFVSLLGLQQAQQKADELLNTALSALKVFNNNADFLRELATYIVKRPH